MPALALRSVALDCEALALKVCGLWLGVTVIYN